MNKPNDWYEDDWDELTPDGDDGDEDPEPMGVGGLHDLTDEPGLDDQLIREEDERLALTAWHEAIEDMPSDLRDIFELWKTGEYSIDELAEEFGLSTGTIRARVSRIKEYLKGHLPEDFPEMFL